MPILHSADLVAAFGEFHRAPRAAAVSNMGGGRVSNCSMLEAIALSEKIAGCELRWELTDTARLGDHRWWIGDLGPFQRDYPGWGIEYDIGAMLREIYEWNVECWSTGGASLPAGDRRRGAAPA